jgi:hypothetical protein
MTTQSPLASIAAIALCVHGAASAAATLRVGAGKESITPASSEFPYAAHGERDFVGVHDDIFARALVIESGRDRVVVAAVEVTKIPTPEALVSDIAQRAGVPGAHVLLAATHTHSVPLFSYHGGAPNPAESREIARLKSGVLTAVDQALHGLQDAQMSFARGQAWVNVNNGEQLGSARGYDPKGPSDKSLDVIRFQTTKGQPIAIVVNYATHAEVMFRSLTRDGGYEVSGDIPGSVSRLLETASVAAPVVLFTSAAEADQLTLFKSLQPADTMPASDEGASGWAVLNVQARRLAASVREVLDSLPSGVSQAQVAAADGQAVCPGQSMRRDSVSGRLVQELRPDVAIPLQTIRINDVLLAGVGGDVSSEIGVAIKSAFPSLHTSVVTMSAGAVGYVLADPSYEHPGHAVFGSPLQPHCAQNAIVRQLRQMVEQRP